MSWGSLIAPHGGSLVNHIVDSAQAKQFAEEAAALAVIPLSSKQACDLR